VLSALVHLKKELLMGLTLSRRLSAKVVRKTLTAVDKQNRLEGIVLRHEKLQLSLRDLQFFLRRHLPNLIGVYAKEVQGSCALMVVEIYPDVKSTIRQLLRERCRVPKLLDSQFIHILHVEALRSAPERPTVLEIGHQFASLSSGRKEYRVVENDAHLSGVNNSPVNRQLDVDWRVLADLDGPRGLLTVPTKGL
jgi:hypothetical protein